MVLAFFIAGTMTLIVSMGLIANYKAGEPVGKGLCIFALVIESIVLFVISFLAGKG